MRKRIQYSEQEKADLAELARKIKTAREEAGLSVPQLAQLCELGEQQLYRIERTESVATAFYLLCIAKTLDKSCDYFLEHIHSPEETVGKLWEENKLAETYPNIGSQSGDRAKVYKMKRAILEAMGLYSK